MTVLLARQILELFLKSRHPVLIADERLDGDSLGSSLAVLHFFEQRGVFPQVFVSGPIPQRYQFLPGIERCTSDVSVFQDETIDLVVSFDCSDAGFITRLTDMIPTHPMVVNIDHHATNARYGDIACVDVGAPATAMVVYDLFSLTYQTLSPRMATCLLTGICFDTTVFSNSGTNARSFEVASRLVLAGGRLQDVIRVLSRHRSVGALRLWGKALERLQEHPDFGGYVTFLTQKDILDAQVTEEEVDGLSDFLQGIAQGHTLVLMRETKDGSVKVSMRSRMYDVSALADMCGGGGHKKAAGFVLPHAKLVYVTNPAPNVTPIRRSEVGWQVVSN